MINQPGEVVHTTGSPTKGVLYQTSINIVESIPRNMRAAASPLGFEALPSLRPGQVLGARHWTPGT